MELVRDNFCRAEGDITRAQGAHVEEISCLPAQETHIIQSTKASPPYTNCLKGAKVVRRITLVTRVLHPVVLGHSSTTRLCTRGPPAHIYRTDNTLGRLLKQRAPTNTDPFKTRKRPNKRVHGAAGPLGDTTEAAISAAGGVFGAKSATKKQKLAAHRHDERRTGGKAAEKCPGAITPPDNAGENAW